MTEFRDLNLESQKEDGFDSLITFREPRMSQYW